MKYGCRRLTMMLGLAGVCGATALGGCADAELYLGPRVVTHTPTSFYIRHIPLLNSDETANEIAATFCSGEEEMAVLTDAYQDVPLGIRYATYECI